MRIFVAGATGVVGQRLLPKLLARGDEVIALTRTASKQRALLDLGARPVIADGLDRDGVLAAVRAAEPEVVVHQMTALAGGIDVRRFERSFEQTNALRTRGIRGHSPPRVHGHDRPGHRRPRTPLRRVLRTGNVARPGR